MVNSDFKKITLAATQKIQRKGKDGNSKTTRKQFHSSGTDSGFNRSDRCGNGVNKQVVQFYGVLKVEPT